MEPLAGPQSDVREMVFTSFEDFPLFDSDDIQMLSSPMLPIPGWEDVQERVFELEGELVRSFLLCPY